MPNLPPCSRRQYKSGPATCACTHIRTVGVDPASAGALSAKVVVMRPHVTAMFEMAADGYSPCICLKAVVQHYLGKFGMSLATTRAASKKFLLATLSNNDIYSLRCNLSMPSRCQHSHCLGHTRPYNIAHQIPVLRLITGLVSPISASCRQICRCYSPKISRSLPDDQPINGLHQAC